MFPRQRTLQLKLIKDPSATFQEANKHLQEEYTMKWINLPLGPSIKDVSPEGEGGGYEKLQIGETFKASMGKQGEGGGLTILKNEETSFMDDPFRN